MKNEHSIYIGKRIAQIRKSHKITQESLAEKLELSAKHVSHVERGTSSYSLKNLIDFCEFFGCSLDYIIFGNESNDALAKLPDEIVDLLYTGNKNEVERLYRYLQFYVELSKKQD